MKEKAKKVYESPSMNVYEMSRTQILAGSDPSATTETYVNDGAPIW